MGFRKKSCTHTRHTLTKKNLCLEVTLPCSRGRSRATQRIFFSSSLMGAWAGVNVPCYDIIKCNNNNKTTAKQSRTPELIKCTSSVGALDPVTSSARTAAVETDAESPDLCPLSHRRIILARSEEESLKPHERGHPRHVARRLCRHRGVSRRPPSAPT